MRSEMRSEEMGGGRHARACDQCDEANSPHKALRFSGAETAGDPPSDESRRRSCASDDVAHARVIFDTVRPRVKAIFPRTYVHVSVAGKEERPLFGDLISAIESEIDARGGGGGRLRPTFGRYQPGAKYAEPLDAAATPGGRPRMHRPPSSIASSVTSPYSRRRSASTGHAVAFGLGEARASRGSRHSGDSSPNRRSFRSSLSRHGSELSGSVSSGAVRFRESARQALALSRAGVLSGGGARRQVPPRHSTASSTPSSGGGARRGAPSQAWSSSPAASPARPRRLGSFTEDEDEGGGEEEGAVAAPSQLV